MIRWTESQLYPFPIEGKGSERSLCYHLALPITITHHEHVLLILIQPVKLCRIMVKNLVDHLRIDVAVFL